MDKHSIYFNLENAYKNYNNYSKETINFFSNLLFINMDILTSISNDELSNFLISILDNIEAKYSQIIIEKYINKKSTLLISQKLFLSKDQINRYKRTALSLLSEKISSEEILLRKELKDDLINSLPFFDNLFYGHECEIESIFQFLETKNENIKLVVSGIGGIGKSTIVNKTIRMFVENNFSYKKINWIRIPNKISNIDFLNFYLDQYFQEKEIFNSIFIIDNINNKNDFELINKYTNELFLINSKIIFTSRYRPIHSTVCNVIWMPEIDKSEFFLFLNNNNELINYDVEISNRLYKVIGGNPFAIKLVKSLVNLFSPKIIHDNFFDKKFVSIDEMFDYIFSISWESLDIKSKLCLKVIPIFKENSINIFEIAEISGLSVIDVLNSISYLYERSLIEIRGNFENKKYGIHYLTHSFLEKINE